MKHLRRMRIALASGLVFGLLILAQLSAQPVSRHRTGKQKDVSREQISASILTGTSKLQNPSQNNPFQNLDAIMQTLRDEYARIVAKFNALRFECKSNMRIRVNEAIAD